MEIACHAGGCVVIRDGRGLGWEHLGATAWRGLNSNARCVVPPTPDAYSVKIQTSSPPLELEWNQGTRQKACWGRGTMAFLPFGEPTRWRWTAPLESLVFDLRLDFWNRVALETFGYDGTQISLVPKFCPNDEVMRQLLLVLADEFYAGAPNGPLFAEGLSLALAARLLKYHSSRPPPTMAAPSALPGWKLQRIKDYIEANLGNRITLADLASVADVSPTHLLRIFRKTIGVAPYRYVLRQRILRAMDLMANSSMDLSEIAAMMGFSSQSHFTTAFRNVTQMTPNAYRRTRAGWGQ